MYAIFLDIETTGLDPALHRVIEIAFKVMDMKTGNEILTYQAIVKQPLEVWDRKDPESVKINGFTWEKIQGGVEEAAVQNEIIHIFSDLKIRRGNAFYLCQNPAFDRTFFGQLVNVSIQEQKQWPYHWLDFASMYWALKVKDFHEKNIDLPAEINLSKNSIAQQYGLPTETIPHQALNGVNHLILCYKTVIGFG